MAAPGKSIERNIDAEVQGDPDMVSGVLQGPVVSPGPPPMRSDLAQLLTCAFLLVVGPGPWSLDALVQKRWGSGARSKARGPEARHGIGVGTHVPARS